MKKYIDHKFNTKIHICKYIRRKTKWYYHSMKIGVFDSGLGGLFTMKSVVKSLPEYDYVYLGDTKRLPYGSRSHETIYEFLKEGVDFLFSKNCALIIVACNTASAEALRTLQQEYLPKKYPNKKVLGMIVPIVEECAQYKTVGLIGTSATIASGAYQKESARQGAKTKIVGLPTPLLVPIIENGEIGETRLVLESCMNSGASKMMNIYFLLTDLAVYTLDSSYSFLTRFLLRNIEKIEISYKDENVLIHEIENIHEFSLPVSLTEKIKEAAWKLGNKSLVIEFV